MQLLLLHLTLIGGHGLELLLLLLVQPTTAAVLILIGVPGVGGVGGVDRRWEGGGGGGAVSQQAGPHLEISQTSFQFVKRKM